MKLTTLCLVATGSLFAGAAIAADAPTPKEAPKAEAAATLAAAPAAGKSALDIIKAKGYLCMSCHQVEVKMVGPSYKDVAAKYKGDAKAPAMLAEKIKKGGVGAWGQIPMPPNGTVTDDDMKAIVDWVLASDKK
jgi:cytochrome c